MKNTWYRKSVICGIFLMLVFVGFAAVPMNVSAEGPGEDPPPQGENGWSVEGTGTYFEITNSSYLNITLRSSENVHVYLESAQNIVSFCIERNCSAVSTLITLFGFEPNGMYYRYQDGYLMTNFTTDAEGEYTYTQDISEPHHVFIQEETSTLYISSDYTFTSDIYETIIVQANNIVIDGNGYTLQGLGSGYGFYLSGRSGVTIKNVTVEGWSYGIYIYWEPSVHMNNNIHGNNINNTYIGIGLFFSDGNTISENSITNYTYGIFVRSSGYNAISINNINNGYAGIWGIGIWPLRYNVISGNSIKNNTYIGIGLWDMYFRNTIYHNNIIDNFFQAYDKRPSANYWHHPNLLEGNYWSDYPGVDDGSGTGKHAIAGDGIGDTNIPWPGTDYDYYPLMHPITYTSVGTNVSIYLGYGVVMRFSEVTSQGYTYLDLVDGSPPPNFRLFPTRTFYEITTTAEYVGIINISIPYDDSGLTPKKEAKLKLKYFNETIEDWIDITTWVDTVNNIIYGENTHLSIFAVMVKLNEPPEANADGPYTSPEGIEITFDASDSSDPDGDELEYRWDFDNDGEWDTEYSTDPTATHTWDNDYSGMVAVEVSDGEYTDTDTATVTVNNVAPTVISLNLPIGPVQIDTEVVLTGTFSDPGLLDTHTATFEWGDTTYTEYNLVVGDRIVNGLHQYVEAGVYTVTLTVTDDGSGSDSKEFQYVVVYDPEGGFVTGGGWINSLEGAYTLDPTLSGKANFGFVSKYKKGQQTPTGNTEFQFKAGDLNFHSSSYDWLVIAGSKAMYKGVGTINGAGNYGFMISAIDEDLTPSTDVDMFRIKIWDKDDNDNIIYDNQLGDPEDGDPTTQIGGGQIKIHNK